MFEDNFLPLRCKEFSFKISVSEVEGRYIWEVCLGGMSRMFYIQC